MGGLTPIGRKIFLQLIELNYYAKGYGPKNHDSATGQEVWWQDRYKPVGVLGWGKRTEVESNNQETRRVSVFSQKI